MSKEQTSFIFGTGGNVGASLARRLTDRGDKVVMFARSQERLNDLASEISNSDAVVLDVTDQAALKSILSAAVDKFGTPDKVVYNAVFGSFGTYDQVPVSTLQNALATNVVALYEIAQTLVPPMAERGSGAFIATGNTSAYRGTSNFAAFAPSKAAQRIYLESLARTVWQQGVHVGYVAIDAVIDQPFMRERFPDKPDEFFCKPDDIAYTCDFMIHQPRSAWTFDIMIRPDGETW